MLSTPASMAPVILLSFPAIFKVVNMSSMNGYDISTLTFVCRLSIMILMHLHFESVLENVRFLKTLVGWVDYHIFLPMVLRCAHFARESSAITVDERTKCKRIISLL